jgi:hypothetical protein
MDKRVFKFQELDREDGTPGRHLAFTDVTFSPLSYLSFVATTLQASSLKPVGRNCARTALARPEFRPR